MCAIFKALLAEPQPGLMHQRCRLQCVPRLLAGHLSSSLAVTIEQPLAAPVWTWTFGGRWRYIGRIPNGSVYQAAQGVFTVEGANIHEAYLVVQGRRLVGFYLPVEQAFSPLKEEVELAFRAY